MVICLDEQQVLTLNAEGFSSPDRILRIAIREGRWASTSPAGEEVTEQVFGWGVRCDHTQARGWADGRLVTDGASWDQPVAERVVLTPAGPTDATPARDRYADLPR